MALKKTTKKATKESGKKNGRPRIEIDKEQFEKLCGLQCTKEEISAFFNCSDDTIERWCDREYGKSFAVVFKQKREFGKISLRRTQFKLAEKSAAMAIFLGKNMLGQTDHVEIVDNTPIEKLDAILGSLREIAEDETKPQTE